MSHISPRQIDDALSGDLPALRAVVAHMEAGCEACESIVDGVDLETLALLVSATEAPAVEPSAAELEHMRPRTPEAPSVLSRFRYVGPAVVLAATLFFALRADVPVEAPDGVKGVEVATPEVTLKVLVGAAGDAGFELSERLEEGGVLTPEATLLFEIDTTMASARTLFVVDSSGEATVLFPVTEPALEAPGPRRVSSTEGWVAYALDDVTGSFTVVAASAVAPHASAEIIEGFASERPVPGVAYASITAVVQP